MRRSGVRLGLERVDVDDVERAPGEGRSRAGTTAVAARHREPRPRPRGADAGGGAPLVAHVQRGAAGKFTASAPTRGRRCPRARRARSARPPRPGPGRGGCDDQRRPAPRERGGDLVGRLRPPALSGHRTTTRGRARRPAGRASAVSSRTSRACDQVHRAGLAPGDLQGAWTSCWVAAGADLVVVLDVAATMPRWSAPSCSQWMNSLRLPGSSPSWVPAKAGEIGPDPARATLWTAPPRSGCRSRRARGRPVLPADLRVPLGGD